MEFPFNVNNLFSDEISRIDSRLTPSAVSLSHIRQYKTELNKIIDEIGKASAKAQGLRGGPITSGNKLAISSHNLYIKIDPEGNNGNGSVIGFLKVGTKNLFIFDRHGDQHELEPLCVLDFYVHESCQRKGSGKQLFEFMLRNEGVQPQHLAIDRPSSKFLSFLQRHYGLKAPLPQVNNFVVFESFFRERSAMSARKISYDKLFRNPYKQQNHLDLPAKTYRSASRKFDSDKTSRAMVVPISVGSHTVDAPESHRGQITSRKNQRTELNQYKYPLMDVPPNVVNSRPPSGTCANTRPPSGTCANTRPPSGRSVLQELSFSRPQSGTDSRQESRNMAAQNSMYSRHEVDANYECAINLDKKPTNPRNPSRESSPPLLRRAGPSRDYNQLFNPGDYLDRRGYLKVGSSPNNGSSPNIASNSNSEQQRHDLRRVASHGDDLYAAHPVRPKPQDTSWNIFGVTRVPVNPRQPQTYQKNQRTALW